MNFTKNTNASSAGSGRLVLIRSGGGFGLEWLTIPYLAVKRCSIRRWSAARFAAGSNLRVMPDQGYTRRKKELMLVIGIAIQLVEIAPGTANQFVPGKFVCICKRHPVWSVGHET